MIFGFVGERELLVVEIYFLNFFSVIYREVIIKLYLIIGILML